MSEDNGKFALDLHGEDGFIVESLIDFTARLTKAQEVSPDQIPSLKRALAALEQLPRITFGVFVEYDIILSGGGEDFKETQYWGILITDSNLQISHGGSTYEKSVGSDRYSGFCWEADEYGSRITNDGSFHDWLDGAKSALNLEPQIRVSDESEIEETKPKNKLEFFRENYVGSLVSQKYKSYAQQVVDYLKNLEATRDDFSNAWEDFKKQIHRGEGYDWWAFEITVRQSCDGVLFQLPDEEKRLLWLWSNGYYNWNEEDASSIPFMEEDVIEELYSTVWKIAADEELEEDLEDEEDEEWEDEKEISDNEN